MLVIYGIVGYFAAVLGIVIGSAAIFIHLKKIKKFKAHCIVQKNTDDCDDPVETFETNEEEDYICADTESGEPISYAEICSYFQEEDLSHYVEQCRKTEDDSYSIIRKRMEENNNKNNEG